MAAGIGCTQGNVGHYKRGQTVPPTMAAKLISYARERGLVIGFDHVYGAAEIPQLTAPTDAAAQSANG